MEEERFFTGYCKAMDQSRMVAALYQDGTLTEADCAYPTCPHATGCKIAREIAGPSIDH